MILYNDYSNFTAHIERDEPSLYDDFLADYQFERDFPFGIPNEQNPIWVTSNGEEIPIKAMTTFHIMNCMKIVGEDDMWYHIFQKELDDRYE